VEDDAQGEDIASRSIGLHRVGRFDLQHFGSHVARSATASVEVFGAAGVLSQAQVDDHGNHPAGLDLIPLDHDVLKLEVAVHDALFVQVGDSLEEIDHDDLGLLNVWKAALLEVSVERQWVELQDHIGRILSLEDRVELADVFVVELGEDLELLHEGNLHEGRGYLAVVVVLREVNRALEALDGDLTSVGEVDRVVDTGSHALAYLLVCLEGSVKPELHDEFSA
jgi:hypothetical protein